MEKSNVLKGRFRADFDDSIHERGDFQAFEDEATWKHAPRAEHYNNDYFGKNHRNRTWEKNLDVGPVHFGKGPKNYIRRAERIFEDTCESLTRSPDVDAQDIEVSVEDGIVTLTGTVLGRRMKREAERLVERVLGVEDVVNLLTLEGEESADQIDESGSPLGGNPNQESRNGNWV